MKTFSQGNSRETHLTHNGRRKACTLSEVCHTSMIPQHASSAGPSQSNLVLVGQVGMAASFLHTGYPAQAVWMEAIAKVLQPKSNGKQKF